MHNSRKQSVMRGTSGSTSEYRSPHCEKQHPLDRLMQSHDPQAVSFASFSAISGTVTSLSKVLFTFPSRYLFAIGLGSLFS